MFVKIVLYSIKRLSSCFDLHDDHVMGSNCLLSCDTNISKDIENREKGLTLLWYILFLTYLY
jgi:hypothetical protein